MIKQIVGFFCFCSVLLTNAQDFSALWQGYFSYHTIKALTIDGNKLYGASENTIFIYDHTSGEKETITTINGLSGENIKVIAYSARYDTLLIGYENGLVELVVGPEQTVVSVVDILDKKTIPPNQKRINHFNIVDNSVYIATDYGISVYDIEALEFGDSYFIGNGGSPVSVRQTAILNQELYAACGTNNGLKKATITNPNLIDYREWQTLNPGDFIAVEILENELYALQSDGVLYEITNGAFVAKQTFDNLPLSLQAVRGNLVVVTANQVYVYAAGLMPLATVALSTAYNTTISSAIPINTEIYLGTTSSGVLKTALANPVVFENIEPEGPLRNDAFKIEAGNNQLWISYGDYSHSYDPAPLRHYGLSYLNDGQWKNIAFNDLFVATNLNAIAINPFKPSQVFVSSFHHGLLELNDAEATTLMTPLNSDLESLYLPSDPSYKSVRIGGVAFDKTGLLWILNSRVDKALKSYDPNTGKWRSFSFASLIPNPLLDELGFGDLAIDNNGTKWIGSFYKGLIGYNENGNRIRNLNSLDQNMPNNVVTAVAADANDQLWIGTIKGLRVLYNTGSFFEAANPTVREIVVMDDGIPQELLSNQYITDIKVDGSNNKWVATLDAGLFCFTPDGQQTIYHFTRQNSPLPSNLVSDLSIDHHNGKVYIATAKGLVSFYSGGSQAASELKSAFVYPNPVRPEYDILGANSLNDITKGIKIKGITDNVNIKITDIEGNLVAEAQSRINQRSSRSGYNFAIDGGTAIWNGKNFANAIVASGVYLIMISDLDSFETKVLKLLIIR